MPIHPYTAQPPVNKSSVHHTFVNRLSVLQRAIVCELAASDWPHPGGLSTLALRRVFGLPWPPPHFKYYGSATGPTASQRASLSRSLRRLERAGYIERPGPSPCYAVALTAIGWAVHRALTETPEPLTDSSDAD